MTIEARQRLEEAFGCHQAGDLQGALRGYEAILESAPLSFDANHLSGVALYQLGRPEDASSRLQVALSIQPGNADAQSNLALAWMDIGRRADALALLDRVIVSQPVNAEARANRAACLNDLGRFGDALEECDAALQISRSALNAAINRGIALLGLDRAGEALVEFTQLAAGNPENTAVWCGLGQVQSNLGQKADADTSYQRALRLNPSHLPTLVNRSMLLCNLGRGVESIALAKQTIALSPNLLEAHMTLGMVLMRQRLYLDAIQAYDAALSIEPGYGPALYSQGLCHLLLGRLDTGFELYEHRWASKSLKHALSASTAPRLKPGDKIAGFTVLMWNDQGLGDGIQMARYAASAIQHGAQVILQVPEPLERLLRSALPNAKVIGMEDRPPQHDFQCPLMSAPWVFGSTLGSIPKPVAFEETNQLPTLSLSLRPSSFRVGVAWSGNPSHVDDARRSLPLRQFASAIKEASISEVLALQSEVRQSDRDVLTSLEWEWRPDAMEDFAATAALINQVDLVVTVDTSVAHLAGSLGKPTWLLLPYLPDWRWWGDGTSTPWYESIRLYRQSSPDDWSEVLEKIATDLHKMMQSKGVVESTSTSGKEKTTLWSRIFERGKRNSL